MIHLLKRRFSNQFERGVFSFFVAVIAIQVMHVTISVANPERSALLPTRLTALLLTLGFLAAYLIAGSQRTKLWIFFLEVAGVAILTTLSDDISYKHGWTVIFHYVAVVVLALSASLVAPEIAFPTIALFAALAAIPLIHSFLWWNPLERSVLGVEEPWITIMLVMCSSVIWYYRRRGIELAQEREKLFTQNELFKRFALLLLGAQHLMNSPLQSIMVNVRLLEMEHPEAQDRIKAIDRALVAVQKVGNVIAFGDEHIRWEDGEIPEDLEGFSRVVQKMAHEMAHSASQAKTDFVS